MSATTLVTVRIRPTIAERLAQLAASMDRSKSYIAAEAIEEYLDIHEWQVEAIHQGIEAVDRGETFAFEDIKKEWEQKIENSNH